MDVLVVVGQATLPPFLFERATRVVELDGSDVAPSVLTDLRARVPRRVTVAGEEGAAPAVAALLRRCGLPVRLHTDEEVRSRRDLEGVEILPLTDSGPPMEVAGSILELVGNTPLVRLDRIGRDLPCPLLAKLELLNPGGSVKDRPAVAMIDAAERAGLLKPGGTIVEGTSGNTGVGLAIVAARRHYKCVFVMPDKMAPEKIALLRAYGAEVVVCPSAVPPDHPDSYYSVTARLAEEIPGAFHPDQYHNPENPAAHVATTGPEIWRQTAGRVSHFVAGIGTGGTITGIGRFLKEQNPDVQVIGADPEGSVYSGGSGRPYLVEGIGEDFWPSTYDPSVIDRVIMVSDSDSFHTARRIGLEEGLLVGGSTGTAVWAALQLKGELTPSDVVVTLVPDSGRGYLSKLYNDEWMADHGFLRSMGRTIGDLLERKGAALPELIHVHPDEPARQAISVMAEFGVSQLAVVQAEPPLVEAEVVGAVHERDLMRRAFEDPELLDKPVREVMGPPLPSAGSGESVDVVVRRLEDAPAVVVVDHGHPVGVVTRTDALAFLASLARSEQGMRHE
ncbi:MAG TPA: cystathionine beta-synthase [Acidimicrobiales bacterium]|nr:cystathionine beta-synthase [Acidimicrobiales bacterium]